MQRFSLEKKKARATSGDKRRVEPPASASNVQDRSNSTTHAHGTMPISGGYDTDATMDSLDVEEPSKGLRGGSTTTPSTGGVSKFRKGQRGKKGESSSKPASNAAPEPNASKGKHVKFAEDSNDAKVGSPAMEGLTHPLTVTTAVTPLQPSSILSPSSTLTATTSSLDIPLVSKEGEELQDGTILSSEIDEDQEKDEEDDDKTAPSPDAHQRPSKSFSGPKRSSNVSSSDYVEPRSVPGQVDGDSDSLGTMDTLSTFDGSLDLGDLAELDKAMAQDVRGSCKDQPSFDQPPAPPPSTSSAKRDRDSARKFDSQASKAKEMLGECFRSTGLFFAVDESEDKHVDEDDEG